MKISFRAQSATDLFQSLKTKTKYSTIIAGARLTDFKTHRVR